MPLSFYYNIFSPPSRAVLLLTDILKLKVEKHVVDLLKGEHLSAEFTKLNPYQNIPVLLEDGVPLVESRAIMTYLIDKYSPNHPLYPTDLVQRQRINSAMSFDATHIFGSMIPLMQTIVNEQRLPDPSTVALLEKNLKKLNHLLSLPNNKFVAGENISLADLSLITSITSSEKMKSVNYENYPKIQEWKQNVKSSIADQVNWESYIEEGAEAMNKMIVMLLNKPKTQK